MNEQMDLFEGLFLAKMRNNWNKLIEAEGGHCPCCGKWGKVYRRILNEHLVLALRWIAVHGDDQGWVDVQNKAPRWILKSKTYPLLAHWGLVESQQHGSGVWKATQAGWDFMQGGMVPEAVYIYDNKAWGFDEKQTSFRGCFGKHFDYEAMMGAQFNWATVRA